VILVDDLRRGRDDDFGLDLAAHVSNCSEGR
jgi:hypothetical protein